MSTGGTGTGDEDKPDNSRRTTGSYSQKKTEMEQERILKAKNPHLKKVQGSAMLQKRLNQGHKFFDSGDYNMAMAKMKNTKQPLNPTEKNMLKETIGGAIPTPETVPVRKISLGQSKLVPSEQT